MKKNSSFHYIDQCLQVNEVVHNSWALGYFKLLIIKICLRFALMLLVAIMGPMCITPPRLCFEVFLFDGVLCVHNMGPMHLHYNLNLISYIHVASSLYLVSFIECPMEKMYYVFLNQKMPKIF